MTWSHKPLWMAPEMWDKFVKEKYGISHHPSIKEPNVVKWNPMPLNPNDYGEPNDPSFEVYDDIELDHDYYPEGDYVERTLVMLKPDSYERNLMGEIISILDGKELKLIGAKQLTMDINLVKKHYKNHVGKGFFNDLVSFMTSGPVFALVYEGTKACAVVRQLIGEKHPNNSPAGSIRGKYASEYPRNLVHGSDNMDEAEYEIKLYFDESELFGSYFKKNQKQLEAQAELKKKQVKDDILAKALIPGMQISYPEQLTDHMTIVSSSGQAYRILAVKKKPKGYFDVTVCGTIYADNPELKDQYKVTLTYDDVSFQTDTWKLLQYN